MAEQLRGAGGQHGLRPGATAGDGRTESENYLKGLQSGYFSRKGLQAYLMIYMYIINNL